MTSNDFRPKILTTTPAIPGQHTNHGRLLEFAARGDAAPLAAVELARALRVERYSKRPDPTRFALKLRDGPPLKLRARDAAAAERWIAALDAWVQRS